MVNNKWMGFAVLMVACAATTIANGQQASRAKSLQGEAISKGFVAPIDRATAINSQGLNDPRLKLSLEQRARIDKIVAEYVQEQNKVVSRFSAPQGGRASPEAVRANADSLNKYTAALGAVMSDEQRKTWAETQAARRKFTGAPVKVPAAGSDGKQQ